jgi:probable rRNA maturation factor
MIQPEINISIKRGAAVKVNKGELESFARAVLDSEGISSAAELGLMVTDSKTIQKLNRLYRGEDEPTDVLSFQMTMDGNQGSKASFINPPDGIRHLGEVVISYPQALKQAAERGHSVERELALLIIHGTLHLLGYDHEVPEEEKRMRARENDIMFSLGWR